MSDINKILEFYNNYEKEKGNWDVRYLINSESPPANANILGLEIIDYDRNFQRNAKVKNSDLKIPFMFIEKIPMWEKTANYSSIDDIIGRFEGINIYSGSSNNNFSLNVIYKAEASEVFSTSKITTPWTIEYIEKLVQRLQALTYPQYDGKFSAPPKVLLNIGNIYQEIPVNIKQVSVNYDDNPIFFINGKPMGCTVTLDLVSSYPLWQAQSGTQIFSKAGDNSVFAYQKLSDNEIF